MNSREILDNSIKRLRRRIRFLLAERYGLLGAGAGMVAASVMVLLSSRYDVLLDYRLWLVTILLGAVAGIVVGLTRNLRDLAVAMAADERTGLKERISTAITLPRDADLDDMEQALLTDAGGHISGLNPRDVFKRRFGMPHYVAGGTLVLLLAAIILPQISFMQSSSRKKDAAIMKSEGAKMVKVAKELKKEAGKEHNDLKKIASRIDQLGKKMETGRMDKKQAMLKAQRLSKEIKAEQDRLAKENSRTKSMQQARADMSKSSRQIAQKAAQEIAKKENIPPQEALKKVPSDKRLAELARKSGPLTEAERKELEQAIKKYSDPSSNLPILAELGEALAKLAENGDFKKAAELMQQLAKKLNLGDMGELDKEALKKQMDELAKALKDTDLDKLAKQMLENAEKLAKMSPEELKKLAEQMKKNQQMAKALEKAGGT
ncbi:MAG: hypothetical protein ACYC27_21440 [Armatimonadota bacterium]